MRCGTCGYENKPKYRRCIRCCAPLVPGQVPVVKTAERPAGKPGMRVGAIAVVLIALFMLALLFGIVMTAAVMFIASEDRAGAPRDDGLPLELWLDDAIPDAGYIGDEDGFEKGEQMISLEQIGGDAICWSALTIYAKKVGYSDWYTLEPLTIKGSFYKIGDCTKVGDTVTFGIARAQDNDRILSHDAVLVSVFQGGNCVWNSSYAVTVI